MKPHRILVVEDESIVSMDIQDRLLRMGYTICGTASTGENAVATALQQRPDLILMDIRLKGEMDGINAAQTIHQKLRTPIIFLTAYSEDSTLDRAKLAEPFGYILKPFDDRELRSSIEIALYKHSAEEEIRRLNRLYDVLSQINQAIVQCASRDALLSHVCRLVVERGEIDLAWIGWHDPSSGRIRCVAGFGLTCETLQNTLLDVADQRTGRGNPGRSLGEETAFVCNDCGPDCCLSGVGTAEEPSPFKSCASFPLRFQGRVCGALNLCTKIAGFFLAREIELLEEVAADISFALDKFESDYQRRRAELALAESQTRLELALEASKMGVFEWDIATNAVFWSDGCMGIFGVESVVREFDEFRALIHPDDAEWVVELAKHSAADRTILEVEYRIVRPDGAVRWIHNVAKTTYDGIGNPLRMVGTIIDTTPRREAAEKLRKSEARLRLATEAARMGIWERDLKSNALHWSPMEEHLMGFEPGTFPGTDQAYRELLHPESVAVHATAQQQVRGESGIFHEELRFRLRDGSERWGLLRGQMLRDEMGEPDRIVGIHLDITEVKRMEARNNAFSQLGFLLSAAQQPAEAGRAVSDTARELWQWDACFVSVCGPDAAWTRELVHFDTIDGKCEMLPVEDTEKAPTSIMQEILRSGAKLIRRDSPAEADFTGRRFGDTSRPSLSLMFAPIRHRGENVGVVSVQSYRRQAFNEEDLQTLQALADHCGGTLARLQAEADLRSSEERFRTVVERAPDAIFVQIDQRFAFVNPTTVRLLGANSAAELLGQPVLERFHPKDHDSVAERIRRLNDDRLAVSPIEEVCLRMDGAPVDVEASAVPFIYAGQPGALVFMRDITERRQAEQSSIEQRNLGLALSAADNLEEAMMLCLDAAMRISGMDAGGIYLFDETTGELNLVVHRGLSSAFVQAVASYASDDPHVARVRDGHALHLRYTDLNLPKADAERNEGLSIITVLPIRHENRLVAVMNVASHRLDELPAMTRHTLESVATQIGAAIVRLRIEDELRRSEQQLRALSRHIETLREEERTRISREIHDELGQMLTGIKMDMGCIDHDLEAFGNDPRVLPIVERLVAATELTDTTIRTVQRIAAELRPGILDKLGLEMALQYEIDQFRKRTGLSCRLLLPEGTQKMDMKVATALFRICQESLTNVMRHARATAVEVSLKAEGDWLALTVGDNGCGVTRINISSLASLGLLGMQERARQVGGSIEFTSPPEGGTRVSVRVPNVAACGQES